MECQPAAQTAGGRDHIDYHQVGYTTVASVLTILRAKEMALRARRGRAYRYEAAVSRDQHLARIVRPTLDAASDPRAVLALALTAPVEHPVQLPVR